jgi:hypothetical protein
MKHEIDRVLAEDLMAAAIMFNGPIGEMDRIISDIDNPELKKCLVTALGNIIGILSAELIFPIAHRYPDLNPLQKPPP